MGYCTLAEVIAIQLFQHCQHSTLVQVRRRQLEARVKRLKWGNGAHALGGVFDV